MIHIKLPFYGDKKNTISDGNKKLPPDENLMADIFYYLFDRVNFPFNILYFLYFEAIPHAPDCLNILRLRRIEFNLLANLLDVDRYGRDVTD